MGDWLMLVCAVLVSLSAGVLLAYSVCLGMFAAFRMHAKQVAAKPAVRVGSAASVFRG